ncbi:MAG TPA: DUF92 domain-containing protein [Gemmatimonadales bacterium]
MSPLTAVALAALSAAVAWLAGSLTAGGAVAATLIGTAVLVGAGWPGGAALAAFFVSSSAVSRIGPAVPPAGDAKGNRRDHRQVLANGGPAALGALIGRGEAGLALWIVTASLAAAAADTWATSAGAWSRVMPRHLLTWRQVPAGTGGGVTLLGCLGALCGALVVAGAGAVSGADHRLWLTAAIGFGGMFVDSALGAAAQGHFRCSACGEQSEWPIHRCGATTTLEGGWQWLDNDGVNALATTLAAVGGWASWVWLSARLS